MPYFHHCTSLLATKQLYVQLRHLVAKYPNQHFPDLSRLNDAFLFMLVKLLKQQKALPATVDTELKKAQALMHCLNVLHHLPAIYIHLSGDTLIVSGDTTPVHDTLLRHHFIWHSSVQKWFLNLTRKIVF